MEKTKKTQTGATKQRGTDAQGRPHPIVENINRKSAPKSKPKVVAKPKSQSQIDTEKRLAIEYAKFKRERDAYNKVKEKTGEIRTQRNTTGPTLASEGYLNKTKSTKKPDKVLEALAKDKNGGTHKKKMKNGGSLSGLKASNKRVGPVDPPGKGKKGAFTQVQINTLKGAKGKASLTKDKQLGATKMAKSGVKMSKKK